jgi:GNAT superfamily N-acetyltransferase
MSAPGPSRIRPFATYDLPGIYRVCGDVDARGRAERQQLSIPDLPGHIFAGPYVVADPDLCWVVADSQGVGGYIVGTADAVEFQRWREEHWFPQIRAQYPLTAIAQQTADDSRYLQILHAPPRVIPAFLSQYPAELHIKLEARAARRGWGTKLVRELVGGVRKKGVEGLHLSVSIENAGAVAFYSRLGFVPFEQRDGNLAMAMRVT